jgi:hypothetical protein
MLVKTTKLMGHLLDTLKDLIERYNTNQLNLLNKNLLIIYFDKVIKLLHVALMHPRDYSVEVLQKFFFAERKPLSDAKQRNWIYLTEMFRIINELSSSCSYVYGQIEVKLALSRFIAEFLIRNPDNDAHLDEMVGTFDGSRYFDENQLFTREELRTYGSLILLEMGLVFRGLYFDRKEHSGGASD